MMSEFDEYIIPGEPGQREKADAWQIAIGLHASLPIDSVQSITTAISKSQFDTLKCSFEELSVLKIISDNPKITQAEITKSIKKSASTVKRTTSALVEKGVLIRRNGRRNGWWEIVN